MHQCSSSILRSWCVLLMTIFAMCTASAYGQGFGSISGTVTDSTGAAIPNASITVTQVLTGVKVTAKTGTDGNYVFPALNPNQYTLNVTASGFQNYAQNNLTLRADQALTANVSLTVGVDTQTIQVSADAVPVDTTTGTLSQVMESDRINDLPLNGRNAATLTTLVAGVVRAPSNGSDQGVTKTFPVSVPISANGSRSDQTNYMLNGGNNTDEYTNTNAPFPFPDALQEFSVQTNNYAAEYGQSAGAVVNLITKSGTSQFHGDVFEYVRNQVFNARSYFSPTLDALKRNQFGGVIGGPIAIPHLGGSHQTFFFFGYQGTRTRNSGNKTAYLPTDKVRAGDFSDYLTVGPNNPLGKVTQIYNPITGAAYPGNIVANYNPDPAILNLEKQLPHVQGSGQISFPSPVHQDFNEYIGRVDHSFGERDRIFGHYYYNRFDNAGQLDLTNLAIYASQSNIVFQSALISESHNFSPNLLNNIVLNYTRELSTRGPVDGSPSVGDFGVNIYQPPSKILNSIGVTGFFSISGSPLSTFFRDNYTLADDFHWTRGRHNLAFGAHLEQSKFDINSTSNLPGQFTFNANRVANASGVQVAGTGLAMANFQLGYLSSFTQASGQFNNNRNHFFGFYVQDSWKATPRLTLNYGVRYEPFFPWREIGNRIELFRPADYLAGNHSSLYPNAPAGLFFQREPGVPSNGGNDILTNFMPRVGLAWDVFGTGKTALRGGGGVFYNSRLAGIFNTSAAGFTPFSYSYTQSADYRWNGYFSNPYVGIAAGSNRFPITSPVPQGTPFPSLTQVAQFDPSGHLQPPVTYAWNLSGEQQFSRTISGRLAYVGSHTSHLVANLEENPSNPLAVQGDPSRSSLQLRRLYPGTSTNGLSNITQGNMEGNANYQSLQATLQIQASRGLKVTANYTWSKALDTLPLISLGNAANLNVSQSYVYPIYVPDYKRMDRGPSEFDRRHVFNASYLYTPPKWNTGSLALRLLVNGWQTSGVVSALSGDPLSIVAGSDVSGTGLNQDRAIWNGSDAYQGAGCTAAYCKPWLNASAFSAPPKPPAISSKTNYTINDLLPSFGNVQKGSFRGPRYVNWDAALFRNFNFTERYNLAFRAEYFNLLNHNQPADPSTSIASSGFGSITSLSSNGTYRLAQLSLKLSF